MVREAIDILGGKASYPEIKKVIRDRQGEVNDSTMTCAPHADSSAAALLLSVLSSLPFEYAVRQKTGGAHVTLFTLAQTPALAPERFDQPAPWLGVARLSDWVLPRVVELCYTAWDMRSLAIDCGFDGPPFRWNEARRYLLQRELDVLYFHLYGFEEPEVEHALGTCRILREQEEARYGEYRCRNILLRVFGKTAAARSGGPAYWSSLEPGPADDALRHLKAMSARQHEAAG